MLTLTNVEKETLCSDVVPGEIVNKYLVIDDAYSVGTGRWHEKFWVVFCEVDFEGSDLWISDTDDLRISHIDINTINLSGRKLYAIAYGRGLTEAQEHDKPGVYSDNHDEFDPFEVTRTEQVVVKVTYSTNV